MKIIYSNPEKSSFTILYDDGSSYHIANPPGCKEDAKIIEDFGGLWAVEKCWVDYHRELDEFSARYERQQNQRITFTNSFAIDAMIKEELTKNEMMKIKMSIFQKPEVKKSKNKAYLTGLRKATDIVDVMKFYGLIRDDNNNK